MFSLKTDSARRGCVLLQRKKMHVTFWFFLGIFKLCSSVNNTCILKSGTVGICKHFTECTAFNSSNLSLLQSCYFTGEIGIYCCPKNSFITASKLTPLCQKVIQTREEILRTNSTKNDIAELPFMVKVLFEGKGIVDAGVLLSEKFVMSSAHAVYMRRSMPVVQLVKSKLNEAYSHPDQNIKIKQVIPHELYIPREAYFDIALLLLEQSIKLNNLALPVCLHNSKIELSHDQKFIRVGWKENVSIINEVQKVPISKCDAIYSKNEYKVKLPDGISSNLFCGRSKECSVNSDGPIHVLINNSFFIYGFTTAINTNCNSELPELYTKISDVVDWIENILSSHN